MEALADALSKPGLEDSCRATVVGLLLRSTLPSVQGHVQTVYHHGLPVTQDSVPLPYRWEMYKEGDPNAFKQHGKLPEWSREVGDKLRLLWQLLLHEIRARGYLQRCTVSQFHAAHTSKFLKFISPQSWDRLDKAGKKAGLKAYLFRKFSTDPHRRRLAPPPQKRQRRADISWNSFWVNEKELDSLAGDVVDAYVRGEHDIRPNV